jgi:uncharacterized protein YecT (DUF1311 family)
MCRQLILIPFFLLTGLAAFSQEADKADSILTKQDGECTDRYPSTAGMVACADRLYRQWDSVMNHYYQKLMKTMNVSQKKALKEAQLSWLQYRNKQFGLISSVFKTMQGTMWIPVQVYQRTDIVKDRAKALINIYELMQEGG